MITNNDAQGVGTNCTNTVVAGVFSLTILVAAAATG
jgi:ABC-type transporter Mla maintaining outer membrane lipid asymmetry permease subunit MlaE